MPAGATERRWLIDTNWKRYGRADIAAGGSTGGGGGGNPRDALVLGSYIPGYTTDTVGARDSGVTYTAEYGNTTTKTFTPTPGATYTNIIFWCKVAPSNTAGGGNLITFVNCYFANRKPEDIYTAGDTNGGSIQSFGNDPAHLVLIDCTIDPQMWYDAALSTYKGHPVQFGIHGGNFTAKRCEFVHCQDGVNYVGPTSQPAADNAYCLMEACRVHANYYLKPYTTVGAPASQDTHSDCFQFNTGKNITIRYCMLGGQWDGVGYAATPAYNSGDDAHNSAIIIQQEAGTLDYQWIENVLIEYCWLSGGAATFNANFKNGNPGADWIVRFCKFAVRGATAFAGAGYQIYWHGSLTIQWVSNVQWDGTQTNLNGNGVAATMNKYPGT